MKKIIATVLIVLMLLVNNSMVIAINEISEKLSEENTQNQENNYSQEEAKKSEETRKSEEAMESEVQEKTDSENQEQVDTDTQNQEDNIQENSEESQGVVTIDANSQEKIKTVSNNNMLPYGDGVYRISLASPEYCHLSLEIKNGSKDLGANVQIGTWYNKNNSKNIFKITYDEEDDTYAIQSTNSGSLLDVENGGTTPGTNVWQCQYNGTVAQKWKIEKNTDGSYSFKSKKNEKLYLNVAGEPKENANIEVNNRTNKVNQKFNLISLKEENKPQKTDINNGIYKIVLKDDLALETQNSSMNNEGNISVGKWIEETSNIQRRFEFIYEDDGYYTIKSVNSGKVLEIQNGKMTEGTNVWQFEENYTDSQRWQIIKNVDGSYSLKNKKSGLYLDIHNKNLSQGENVEVNNKNDSNSQKFKIESITNDEETLITDGIYRISPSSIEYNYLALEIRDGSKDEQANVQVGEWNNKNNDKNKFQITYDKKDGCYTIQSINSKNMLDVQNGGMTPETNVWQYKNNDTPAQKWKIIINDDKSCSFKSQKNGLYINVAGSIGIGSNVEITDRNNEVGQKFELIPLDKKLPRTLERDGVYKIETNTDENMVVGIEGNLSENVANASINKWTDILNGQKKFIITYNNDDGYYTIENVYSGKVLEAQGGGFRNGANVSQYESNNTDSQRWQIIKNEDGTYSFVNKKSKLYLSVENKDGNVELYEKSNSKEQKFKIEAVDITDGVKVNEEKTYKIISAKDEKVSLDVENASRDIKANIQLGNTSNTITNEFNFVPDGRGYYIIKSVNSGNVLDAENGGTVSGTNLWQYAENGTDAQKWIIKQNTNGTYSIISKKSGLYIDIYNAKATNGNNIWLVTGNDTIAQEFNLDQQEYKTEKYVDEGVYKVETKLNTKIAVDIELTDEVDRFIQIWNYTGEEQQKFYLKYEDGYYYIISILSGKYVTVDGNDLKECNKNSNNNNQKWILKKQGDYYNIVSKGTNLVITIPNRSISNGNNLNAKAQADGDYSLFKFKNFIEEGTYKIVSTSNEGLSIDIKDASRNITANVQLGYTSNSLRNEFNFVPDGNGYYIISSINSGNVLDVENGGMASGTNVWQCSYNGTDAQKWKIKYNEDKTFSIISKKNGLALDIYNGTIKNGNNIWVYTPNGSNAQKFQFKRQTDKTEKYIEDGDYKILADINLSKGWDIDGASKKDGAVLQLWDYEILDQKQFKITYQYGYYYIISKNSNKAIQATNSGIRQYTLNYDNENQKWILKHDYSNCYKFVCKATGLYVTIPNSNASNDVDLVMKEANQGSQTFSVSKAEPKVVLQKGTYGSSGYKVAGNSKGCYLEYYKIGNGPNVFFGTFAVHGFEDGWDHDGDRLTIIANTFRDKLLEMQDRDLANKWTIYLFPSVNPDGEFYGWSNDGPGRRTIYSEAPRNGSFAAHDGIDINRCWSVGYKQLKTERNYNGTQPLQAYEARALRDFLLDHRATNGQTILVDLHGWMNMTIGDDGIGSYYRPQYGIRKHQPTYGGGYLINWAQSNLGYGGRRARSCLVELPEFDSNPTKYINATLNMLRYIV